MLLSFKIFTRLDYRISSGEGLWCLSLVKDDVKKEIIWGKTIEDIEQVLMNRSLNSYIESILW
jgi:hypothetical protein